MEDKGVFMDHITIAEMAIKSILYEVTTSPKPGLVDRVNNGAHKDMDFYTFMASSAALSHGFYELAKTTSKFEGTPIELLDFIRPIGIEMELKMYAATSGVNTHKGIIFSLGLCVAAAVKVSAYENLSASNVIAYVKKMTKDISMELKTAESTENTNGEKTFKTYGMKGIRGEAESGYPTVMNYGLDVLKNSYYNLDCKNDSFIQVLFSLMTTCEDSNIVSRHNPETLKKVQDIAKKFLNSGGMYQENAHEILKELDQKFMKSHVSPGGSADLLAVTIFFGLIENIIS